MSRPAVDFISIATLCTCLIACSPRNPAPKQPDDAPQPQAAASTALANSPLGPLLKDRDRAKAVQNVVDDQAAKQRAAIDAQSH